MITTSSCRRLHSGCAYRRLAGTGLETVGPRLAFNKGARKMRSLGRDLLVVLAVFAAGGSTLAQAKDDPWEPFHFLIGEWIGQGKEGQGTGHFSLAPDLGG